MDLSSCWAASPENAPAEIAAVKARYAVEAALALRDLIGFLPVLFPKTFIVSHAAAHGEELSNADRP